jgi:hypothetical protein
LKTVLLQTTANTRPSFGGNTQSKFLISVVRPSLDTSEFHCLTSGGFSFSLFLFLFFSFGSYNSGGEFCFSAILYSTMSMMLTTKIVVLARRSLSEQQTWLPKNHETLIKLLKDPLQRLFISESNYKCLDISFVNAF